VNTNNSTIGLRNLYACIVRIFEPYTVVNVWKLWNAMVQRNWHALYV